VSSVALITAKAMFSTVDDTGNKDLLKMTLLVIAGCADTVSSSG